MAENDMGHDRAETPLDALGIMASQQAIIGPNLRQLEMYTRRGLLSLLWHEPDGDAQNVGVVMVGGAMGGTLGPGDSLFHALGEALVAHPAVKLVSATARRGMVSREAGSRTDRNSLKNTVLPAARTRRFIFHKFHEHQPRRSTTVTATTSSP